MMGGSPAVARSTIEDNDVGMYQKFSYYCSDHYSNPAMVTNCAILRNRIGIYSPGSSSTCCEMSGNRIANNREAGVSLSYWSRISLKNNTFSGSPVCFSASETSSGDVRDNVFDNCSTAAFETTSCPMSFTCNTVRNCGKGIRIGGPVSGNLFENNKGPAITIQAQLDAHDNSFINNGPVDVLQTTSAQCDFSCNYWGTTNADEVAARIVDFASSPTLGAVTVFPLREASCFCCLRTTTVPVATTRPTTVVVTSTTSTTRIPVATTPLIHSSTVNPTTAVVAVTSTASTTRAATTPIHSSTVNPTTTAVARPTTSAPHCDCHHGYATFGCRCVCYAPFGGDDCSVCSTLGYILDNTGSCKECVRPFSATIATLSGSTVTIPVQRSMPGCTVALAVELFRSGTAPVSIPFAPSDSNITFSMTCATSERAYIYFNRTMLFARILCKAPVE